MPEGLDASSEQKVRKLRTFIQDELAAWEADAADVNAHELRAWRAKVSQRSRELGLFQLTQPKSVGGTPATQLELVALQEELAAANLPKLGGAVWGPGPGLLSSATGQLYEEYVLPMLRGEKRSSFGFTEPADVKQNTVAVKRGSDLIITGQKSFVTGGDTADFVVALCNLRESDGVTKAGTAMVVIDLTGRDQGVVTERIFSSLDGEMRHAYLRFDAVIVPSWRAITPAGNQTGMGLALGTVGNMRLNLSAQACGISLWALRYLQDVLTRPHRGGVAKASKEGVRIRYGELHAQVYAARAMLYRTARLVQAGEKATAEVVATKLMCTETAGRVIDGAVQLTGDAAVVCGHPLEAAYRKVRTWRFTEGESDLLRLKLADAALQPKQGDLRARL